MEGTWQGATEAATRRWWFLFLLGAIALLPPYASGGYDVLAEWGEVQALPIRDPVFSPDQYYPAFKILPLVFMALAASVPRTGGRLLAAYAAINCVGFIFHQAVGRTEQYGWVIDTDVALMFALVAAAWAWEARMARTDFTPGGRPPWRYWVVPVALLAFWYPLDPRTGMPDFRPSLFFGNGAGLAFCTMTPLYVGLLTLCWPRVNLVTLRVTSLIGLIAAWYNLYANFVQSPSRLWWNGVLHLPLLVVCGYGAFLSLRGQDGGRFGVAASSCSRRRARKAPDAGP